jgi:hypothetical protein
VKASICLAILLCIAALGYGAYYLFFGGSNFFTTLHLAAPRTLPPSLPHRCRSGRSRSKRLGAAGI